jgi:sugar (pentulose or hexulose) kinase
MNDILAIDQSTSATKAVLFDVSGWVVDRASPDLPASWLGGT